MLRNGRFPRIVGCLFVLLALSVHSAADRLKKDAQTVPLKPTTNYGSAQIMAVTGPGASSLLLGGANVVAYLQFDPVVGPAGSPIFKVELVIYVDAVVTPGSIDVHTLLTDWSESTITANNAPGLGPAVVTGIPITQAGFISIDVTAAYQAGIAGNGFAIVANSGTPNVAISIDTKENLLTSHAADLDVIFVGPQGPQGEKGDKGDPGPPGPITNTFNFDIFVFGEVFADSFDDVNGSGGHMSWDKNGNLMVDNNLIVKKDVISQGQQLQGFGVDFFGDFISGTFRQSVVQDPKTELFGTNISFSSDGGKTYTDTGISFKENGEIGAKSLQAGNGTNGDARWDSNGNLVVNNDVITSGLQLQFPSLFGFDGVSFRLFPVPASLATSGIPYVDYQIFDPGTNKYVSTGITADKTGEIHAKSFDLNAGGHITLADGTMISSAADLTKGTSSGVTDVTGSAPVVVTSPTPQTRNVSLDPNFLQSLAKISDVTSETSRASNAEATLNQAIANLGASTAQLSAPLNTFAGEINAKSYQQGGFDRVLVDANTIKDVGPNGKAIDQIKIVAPSSEELFQIYSAIDMAPDPDASGNSDSPAFEFDSQEVDQTNQLEKIGQALKLVAGTDANGNPSPKLTHFAGPPGAMTPTGLEITTAGQVSAPSIVASCKAGSGQACSAQQEQASCTSGDCAALTASQMKCDAGAGGCTAQTTTMTCPFGPGQCGPNIGSDVICDSSVSDCTGIKFEFPGNGGQAVEIMQSGTQTASLGANGNITGNVITGTQFCLGKDCRTTWPMGSGPFSANPPLTISNSTISLNVAAGGGLATASNGTLTLDKSVITNNVATAPVGGGLSGTVGNVTGFLGKALVVNPDAANGSVLTVNNGTASFLAPPPTGTKVSIYAAQAVGPSTIAPGINQTLPLSFQSIGGCQAVGWSALEVTSLGGAPTGSVAQLQSIANGVNLGTRLVASSGQPANLEDFLTFTTQAGANTLSLTVSASTAAFNIGVFKGIVSENCPQ